MFFTSCLRTCEGEMCFNSGIAMMYLIVAYKIITIFLVNFVHYST